MNDLRDDLLADLAGAATAAAPAPAPAAPAARPTATRRGTPALDVRVTPLRWAFPQVTDGGLRVGPLQVRVTRTDA